MSADIAASATEQRFGVEEKSIAELQAALAAGRVSSKQLVQRYLARIRSIDKAGPKINSVVEVNPDAPSIAAALDRERRKGRVRGPLHGIPILIKDNIATADRMETTAGSLALLGVKPPRDASVVSRLREAGAVILGKTNLSEWANIRSTRSTSGWSARGGLTRNPYALDRNAAGSSSGSAAAIAASLAAIAVGTETDGSITKPCSFNGLVGIKPTVGLVSAAGIIPISHSQDTAGPMARCVADAALLLGAMAGADYSGALDADALRGARLGVVRKEIEANALVGGEMENALEILRSRGAILVDVELPEVQRYREAEVKVMLYELKAGLEAYLAEYAPGSPVKSLEDVIAYNEANATAEMPYFAQELFVRAEALGGLYSPDYLESLATSRRFAREEGIDKALASQRLDALVAPTCGPAYLTDFVNGNPGGQNFSTPAAVAGYPHVTVPAGAIHGLPIGLSFVGKASSEARLIALAYAFEQASRARRPPTYAKTVNDW